MTPTTKNKRNLHHQFTNTILGKTASFAGPSSSADKADPMTAYNDQAFFHKVATTKREARHSAVLDTKQLVQTKPRPVRSASEQIFRFYAA